MTHTLYHNRLPERITIPSTANIDTPEATLTIIPTPYGATTEQLVIRRKTRDNGIQQTYTWRQQLSNQIGFARQPPSFCRSAQHPTVLALINSCQELKIKVDSLDCVAIEGILVDVFMKYTLQF
ncbi:hypothetical protein PCANC_27918 [Puccinia coronata f. sp. avenae]|uniref:Uncharacterized protein n=1 Tax=Puccinia coronata f. sp. avenae TaxID=200324 RepID=A0A2N5TDA1_9BASI|nr:hypothetical protein PCANC_27918 [Puccinia coronata f. sp. avenae]